MFLRNLIDEVTDFHDRFKKWKPLHWCWWFEKHGLPIPRYLIGGAPVLDQRTYNIGDDDAAGGDPDSCTFDGADTPRTDQAKEENFMVRIGVAEDGGNPTGSKNWQLYGHTSDVPADATLIDTGTTTAWASITPGSITDKENCTDELCTAQAETFSALGQALDVSDETDKIILPANNNCEFQFCIQ